MYMLLIYGSRSVCESWPVEAHRAVVRGHVRLQAELAASGELLEARALADPVQTVTVTCAPATAPGSPAGAYLAGYYVVECEHKGRAVEIAARIPEANYLPVEVRPLMEEAGLEM
jgi:hypothetical protein